LYSREDKLWKLSDFGITSEGTSTAFRNTDAGRGTAGYRPPEVILESMSGFNNKADIWALGCIFFELATGKPAFNSDGEVLEHYHSEPSLNFDWDEMFDEATQDSISKIVHDMLRKESHLRPSASKLRQQFQELELASELRMTKHERWLHLSADPKGDQYYTRALERLSDHLRSWAVSMSLSSPGPHRYSEEQISAIRAVFAKLKEKNPRIPDELLWKDVDLQRALLDSEFRSSFVQHVAGFFIHEYIFSPFSYRIHDFGLGYWLKRYSDEVTNLGMQLGL